MGQVRAHPDSHTLVGLLTALVMAAALAVAPAHPAEAYCPADEAHGTSSLHRRIDRVLADAEYWRKTHGGTRIYEKNGGFPQAQRDFDYIRQRRPFQRGERDHQIRWVNYPDGTKVTVYPSRTGPPTMHIIRRGRADTKVRYR